MTVTGGTRRIYSVPPGAGFLRLLAEALVDDTFGFGLPNPADDPMALSAVTVYLPTRRAARVLRSEIADRLGTGSAILPVIRALGETDDDTGYFEEDTPVALELDPPVGTVDAILSLAELVLAWKSRLPEAIAAHLDGAPMMAPANPADAVWLARALFDLVQAVESEEADFARLDEAIEADLQEWWRITAEFLKVAREFWPALLGERNQSSPAAHHNALIDAETRRIAEGRFEGPVVVAGSTGTRPSTARLIAAIAGHRQGAVVLPGLDKLMAPAHWAMISDFAEPAGRVQNPSARLDAVTIRSHPQYSLFRLLGALGLPPSAVSDIPELGQPPETIRARNRLVSTALLPAAATTAWSDAAVPAAPDLTATALAGVTLIEAANEREEAQALAAAMRAALEPTAGNAEPVAALVTPDRALARRVVIELGRYGIEADDSGGRSLGDTSAGSLARLAVSVAFGPSDPVALAALIKHPLARFGCESNEARRLGETVETLGLRGRPGEARLSSLPDLVMAGKERRETDRHAPAWLHRLSETEIAQAQGHARKIVAAFEPLTALFADGSGTAPVGDLAFATALVVEAIARDAAGSLTALWGGDAGKALAGLLSDCRDSRTGLAISGFEWIAALEALLSGQVVKPEGGGHPRAFVWGSLEARLQHVDTVLLGGLNEGSWPAPGKEDPFLSRAMKAAIGLEPPERRIGQAAHDVQMAIAMPHAILSRSLRAGRAPTVASRWLQRLAATAGPEALGGMRERGEAILKWLRAAELAGAGTFPGRPEPHPPAGLQPTSYSFSEVGRLRRDPYSIYAKRILGLDPLDDFIADPGPRERGTIYHAILERFVRDAEAADLTEQRLMAIADEVLDGEGLPIELRLVWRNRLSRAAPVIAGWEAARAANREKTFVEAYARMTLPSGAELRGLADRIEILSDGSASLIDYKTGASPSLKQARTLLDPQLALEAHVLGLGGFRDIGPLPVSELLYLRLTGNEKYEDRVNKAPRKEDDPDYRAEALAARAAREFEGLVSALRDGRRGYMSRVIPKSAREFSGDYDHLARVAEWQTAAEGENGGGDD
ncbi:double-strand break repair protein AddB [Pseudohoeflea suaedae]|uniref:double-strand break repair protein AddB n=1 Tax=Pseudohoeflea suaedae TaxID=877384 RepID=UPI0013048E15|nr:double-strand break repair protein AddB [Pseudohoeflea suaedae]